MGWYLFQMAGCSIGVANYTNLEDKNLQTIEATYKLLLQNPMLVCNAIGAFDTRANTAMWKPKELKTRR
jgi:hypothetical protein